jgi:hypothetical protein
MDLQQHDAERGYAYSAFCSVHVPDARVATVLAGDTLVND